MRIIRRFGDYNPTFPTYFVQRSMSLLEVFGQKNLLKSTVKVFYQRRLVKKARTQTLGCVFHEIS